MSAPYTTAQWLAMGGDRRITVDPVRGANAYGCKPVPVPDMLAYGSVTASTISQEGFRAAQALHRRLGGGASPEAYAEEMERLRHDIVHLAGLEAMPGLAIVFAASGTDAHLLMAHLLSDGEMPMLAITIEASETGSGVPAALGGRHFSRCTAMGNDVFQGEPVVGNRLMAVAAVSARTEDGLSRPAAAIDADVEALVRDAVADGKKILLVITDTSKTGLVAPSPACALSLQERFPGNVDLLVDACQFRLAPETLHAYLSQGFPVAITGSKFMTGPAFSGALLIPGGVAARLERKGLPAALGAYSVCGDWPQGWEASRVLPNAANTGLLLRWEAALAQWRAFHTLPEAGITAFAGRFAAMVEKRLASDATFVALPVPALAPNRTTQNWDTVPTIFPFLLRGPDGAWVNRDGMKRIYERLQAEHCQLGQPVLCGTRHGIPLSALRLSLSARLIADAVLPEGRGADAVIAEAMSVLDRVARAAYELQALAS